MNWRKMCDDAKEKEVGVPAISLHINCVSFVCNGVFLDIFLTDWFRNSSVLSTVLVGSIYLVIFSNEERCSISFFRNLGRCVH